jgi:predicted dehydrogenase
VTVDEILRLDSPPRLPRSLDRGIGIVGAGAIVNAGHLPAYRKAGFNVVAVADTNVGAARETARQWDVPAAYGSVDELLADPEVEIVDVAVTPDAQHEVASKAFASGRHALCQKPLAEDLAPAVELVGRAQAAGVRMAVNQQMRWDSVVRCTKQLLDAGWYGEPTGALFDVSIMTDWRLWPWMAQRERLEYLFHSVHYFDSIRHLFGEPTSVVASTARFPGQPARGESRTFTIVEYSDTLKVAVVVDHNNWSPEPRAIVRCDGTDGRSEGTLGVLYDYPVGRPDTFRFLSRTQHPEHAFERRFEERWIPDAFVGPMAELQLAIEDEREPLTSGRDNLRTLRVLACAYRSAAEGRRVPIEEVELPE